MLDMLIFLITLPFKILWFVLKLLMKCALGIIVFGLNLLGLGGSMSGGRTNPYDDRWYSE